jgi:hypothetical protein
LESLACNSCTKGEHQVLHREKKKIDSRNLVPQIFILSDQNFPAALPVEGDGECLKILRIENGKLSELVESFLEVTKGFTVPAGSVVVLTSVSHLAGVGTVEYINQFTVARGRLLGEFQGGLEVVHGFPVLLCGMSDKPGIRALIDCTDWFASVPVNTNRFLNDTLQHFWSVICNFGSAAGLLAASALASGSASLSDQGSGSPAAPDQLRFLLPKDLGGKNKKIFLSCPDKVPMAIPPIDSDTESELLTCLITELNNKFLADLAPLARDNSGGADASDSDDREEVTNNASMHKNTRLIMVGGSHAARIASALDNLGLEIADLSSPGWTVTDANVQ